jgi:hypothetical protein
MVFLFLVAATLAVLSYMKSNNLQEDLNRQKALSAKVASGTDMRNETILQMVARHDAAPAGKAQSVAEQFIEQTSKMNMLVTGRQDATVEQALSEGDAALAAMGATGGLAVEAQRLSDQAKLMRQQLDEKDKLLAQRQQELQAKDSAMKDSSEALQKRIDDLQAKVQDMDQQLAAARQTYQASLDGAQQDWQKQRDDLNKSIADKTALIDQRTRENGDLIKQVDELRKMVGELKPGANPMTAARRADGKIMKMVPADDTCYINLGSKDNVSAGITFTVYPSTGIPADGEGKARLRVTYVGDTISECRLFDQKRDDPVVEGDLVANLAFDPTRTSTFVVLGRFDLYGTGSATDEGANEAKTLITRFGGKVADDVSIQTDYVVLGDRPAVPAAPTEFAPPQEREVYNQQLKVAQKYDEQEALAKSLQIPVLSTNRFLAFIGYQPSRAGS